MHIIRKEIDDQFNALDQTVEYLSAQSKSICDFFRDVSKVVIFGCGSSFSVAKSYAMFFSGMVGIPAFAVAAGDYIVNENDYKSIIKDSAIITVSRSGSTSEIIRGVKIAQKTGALKVLSVCGAKEAEIAKIADLNIEMPWIYDYAICQTRTVNNLYAAGLMIAAIISGDTDTVEKLKSLSGYFDGFREKYLSVLEQIAKSPWNHGVVLADSYMAGLAEEGALAFKEICQLNSNHYHVLDVRHGPKVMINKDTIVISMITSGNRMLQQDLVTDIKKTGALNIVIDCAGKDPILDADVRIELPNISNEKVSAIFMLYCIQNITYFKALQLNVNPDSPDGLDAWIKLS